ncbi:MAG: hypothetical protein IPJ17_07100 [Holophagales bacterium]|nr:MAG: hypothetical protein IPJ17_07100 [Holophagales bacterium]
MSKEFNLPGSSFEEVQKILKGYSHASENASLDAMSKLTGLHTTVVSRNNKFLVDLGLIAGAVAKTATDLGRRLGRALDHNQAEDARRYWKEAVQTNEKVSGLVTTVRIKGGMSEKDFSDHVLYVSGQKNNAGNKTGARCVVDMLLAGGLLVEADGKLTIASPGADQGTENSVVPATKAPVPTPPPGLEASVPHSIAQVVVPPPDAAMLSPQIAINIQLHLPETENAEVYEKLFRALREHLLSPKA